MLSGLGQVVQRRVLKSIRVSADGAGTAGLGQHHTRFRPSVDETPADS
jgi:hypothetical protein